MLSKETVIEQLSENPNENENIDDSTTATQEVQIETNEYSTELTLTNPAGGLAWSPQLKSSLPSKKKGRG